MALCALFLFFSLRFVFFYFMFNLWIITVKCKFVVHAFFSFLSKNSNNKKGKQKGKSIEKLFLLH